MQLHYSKPNQQPAPVNRMIKYNKLSCLILLSLASQFGHSLSFDNTNIQSSQGQLLYAEIPYRDANPDQPLQVSFASGDDLSQLAAMTASTDNLNLFVRRSNNTSGVIVITSNQPMQGEQLNIALKVKDGNGTFVQQIKKNLSQAKLPTNAPTSSQDKTLIPQLVTEKEIALNLPTSTLYTTPVVTQTPAASSLNQAVAVQTLTQPKPQQSALASAPSAVTAPPNTSAQQNTPIPVRKPIPPKAALKTERSLATPEKQAYTVQHQDSLWRIAERIAKETHQPIAVVMKQIKALNEHAFVSGNINRLKQGAVLNLNVKTNADRHVSTSLNTTGKPQSKYRLDEAQMRLLSDNSQSAASSAQQTSASKRHAAQLIETRQQTLSMQKHVSQLDFALQQKDHKLQVLNARLAKLQQQLQQRQAQQKQQHH